LALLVEGFHGALEDVFAQRLMIGPALPGARRLDDLDVETLIAEKAFVAGDQQRQIVNGVHHRRLYFLQPHDIPPDVFFPAMLARP
jgi:hypothetical protein